MERQLIEALASLKGGKKKLRDMLEAVSKEYEDARQTAVIWSEKAQQLEESKRLIEKLSAREEKEKENSIGE